MSLHEDSFHQRKTFPPYDIHLDKKTYIKNNQLMWEVIQDLSDDIKDILSRLKNIEKR